MEDVNLSTMLDLCISNEVPSANVLIKILKKIQEKCTFDWYTRILSKIDVSDKDMRHILVTKAFLVLCENAVLEDDPGSFSKISTITLKQLEALTASPENHDEELDFDVSSSQINLLLKLSNIYHNTGRYLDSIHAAQQCLLKSEESQDIGSIVKCYDVLCRSSWTEGRIHDSILHNNKLLHLGRYLSADELKKADWNNHFECQILLNLYSCYEALGELDFALRYAKEYLRTVQYVSEEDLINIYSYLGRLQCSHEDFTSALHSHEMELAIAKKYHNRARMAKAYGHIGLVYAALGKKFIANEYLSQKLLMAKSLGELEIEMSAFQDIGKVKLQVGDIGAAINSYKQLYKLAREIHDWKRQCIAYVSIGKLYQQRGTLNFARFYLEQGMQRAKDANMARLKIDAEMHLAQVLKKLGYYEDARRHFKEAIFYFEDSLDITHYFEILASNNLINELFSCYRNLQEVLIKLNCWEEAFEIAELKHSKLLYSILKRREVKNDRSKCIDLPITLSEINEVVNKLPPNTTILCYSLTSNGFLLWLLKPGKGLMKYVKQNELASYPLEQLVRDCVRNLGISKKGNRCCYATEYRENIANTCKESYDINGKLDDASMFGNASCRIPGCMKHKLSHAGIIPASLAQHLPDADISNGIDTQCSISNSIQKTQDIQLPLKDNQSLIVTRQGPDSCKQINDAVLNVNEKCNASKIDTATSNNTPVKERVHYDNMDDQQSGCTATNDDVYTRENLLRELFKLLLGKVEHLLESTGNDQLIIIADGLLNVVPFHLLIDKNGKALHERFLISLLPCFALLALNPREASSIDGTALVYGNSSLKEAGFHNFCGDEISLETENTEQELRLVSKILGVRCHSGKNATKENFIRLASRQEILHISALGSVSKGFLLFTPNTNREKQAAEMSSYVLDLNDLIQLDLNSKIVVLSCCDQCPHGLAESKNVELNLAIGFLAAGASSVVLFRYAVPNKALRMITHKLYRLLEQGYSVLVSLSMIYREMTSSKEFSHPGYWGGLMLIGRDTTVDIRAIRKRALGEFIDHGIAPVKQCLGSNKSLLDFNEFSLSAKAENMQVLLAALLSTNDSFLSLEVLKDLLFSTIEEMRRFIAPDTEKKLAAVQINEEVIKLKEFREILHFLGFKIQPALFERESTYLMLPSWNFDGILQNAFLCVSNLYAIKSISTAAGFSLSQGLPKFTKESLKTIQKMITRARTDLECKLRVSDTDVILLWATVEEKRFLQDIGFHAINTNLHLCNESPYCELQDATKGLVSTLLLLYVEEENSSLKLLPQKANARHSWFPYELTREEMTSKHLLARNLHATNKKFRILREHGRGWHSASLDSLASATSHKIHIGPIGESTEKGERLSHGVIKVKVKPGGTPSSCRFPIVDTPKVTKYEIYKQREKLEQVYIERNNQLTNRKHFEISKLYSS